LSTTTRCKKTNAWWKLCVPNRFLAVKNLTWRKTRNAAESPDAGKQEYVILRTIVEEKCTKLNVRVTDPVSCSLLSAVSKSVSLPIQKESMTLGPHKQVTWMVWMMEFEASLYSLPAQVTSEIYHGQHLCDKNGWTLCIWKHAREISITAPGTSVRGLIMWPIQDAGKEQKWFIWLIKVKYHTASICNRLDHCLNSPAVHPYLTWQPCLFNIRQ
jgi:hypothetical protein